MIMILPRYSIHSGTMALIAANHTDYKTVAIEPNRKCYIKQKPIQLIKQACLDRFITYEGVIEAVEYHTGFKRKVPIPLDPHLNIYLFPTHATNHKGCIWLSYKHVRRIENHPNTHPNTPSSTILFKNGDNLPIQVSPYILKRQMERTLVCMDGYLDSQHNGAVIC
ncbi:competence protein ComK [Oceanobacillus sp. Castelsardo]|uniref:competence protein ComK n=1 Tax=Oceanobacillus sp. Castelsardo TaxID=1851204 RepID=UPI000838E8F6|nr:competence protein ComK [Oceanobacillus sp. Castelsardo]